MEFLADHWLDILTTVLGLIYIWLEYRSNILLWYVGIIMPALDIFLYWDKQFFGDSFMAAYYTVAHLWGYIKWKWNPKWTVLNKERAGGSTALAISHMPVRFYLPATVVFLAIWAATWWVLTTYTRSPIPVADAFTNAMSFVALWALARKYVEQWIMWIVVDAVCAYLYAVKGIPFKACLYSLYVVIAVFGYRKWLSQMAQDKT